MTDRDSPRDETDALRPKHEVRSGFRDPAQVAENEAAHALQPNAESSYRAASPRSRATARRDSDDAPFEVRIEFVRLDGPEGQALRRRQAQIMRKVLQWISDHPDPDRQ